MNQEAVNLAIPHLPDAFAQLVRGSLYAIVCDDETASAILIAGIAHRARRGGKMVHLASAMQTTAPAADSIAQLERNGPIADAVLVIDQAERLFQLSDARRASHAAQTLAQWATARRNTVIAVFGRPAAAPRQFLNLRAASEHLAGFAQLQSADGSVYSLEFRHWIGAAGMTRRRTFSLNVDSSSALVVNETVVEGSVAALSPREALIAMAGSFDEASASRARCREVPSLEAAVAAAGECDRATVVLLFDTHREFNALCDAVAAIRALGRRSLRVVVRERGVRLRVAQSIALLRLGVSEIASGAGAAQIVEQLVASLQGSRFERRFERDVAQVAAQSRALVAGGLLEPAVFRGKVESAMAATESFNLGHALLRLYARPGRQLDTIQRMENRLRDTAIARNGLEIWVFLFGCDRGDVRPVLDRVFKDSLSELVSDWSVLDERARILNALESIRLESAGVVAGHALDLVS